MSGGRTTSSAYRDRFLHDSAVVDYEETVYSPDSHSTAIWQLQQKLLGELLQEQRKSLGRLKILDFACGSGRIASFVERFADSVTGIDISPAMAELARQKCRKAIICVGDICGDASPVAGRFDVITAFRFLLNAEPPLREAVLLRLRQHLDDDHGLLVINVHGNSRSVRHLAIVRRRLLGAKPGQMLSEMSINQTRALLEKTGFRVSQVFGYALMPSVLYRTPLRKLASLIDRYCASHNSLAQWSTDLVFVCKAESRRA